MGFQLVTVNATRRHSIPFGFTPEWSQSLGDGIRSNFDESSFIVVLHALEKSASPPTIRMEPKKVVQTQTPTVAKQKQLTFCGSSPQIPCSPGYAYAA
jgi:hypothetical protein